MKEIIRKEIDKNEGRISFKEFMELCLYHPDFGYYQKDMERTGKRGDFYTSPNVSSVFGSVVARYIYRMWEQLGQPDSFQVIEFGAGKGQLAEAILHEISSMNKDLHLQLRYFIIDASESFKSEQKQRLQNQPVDWIQSVLEIKEPIIGCILSNELIDAFPVHWVRYENGMLYEKFVRYDENTKDFAIVLEEANVELNEYFKEQQVQLEEGQEAEVNLDAKTWLAECAASLDRGYILTIDYGFLRDELYADHRKNGTLLCYHKHRVNEDPLKNIGEQDITSHVNFSQLISWGERLGLETLNFMNQQEFLMQGGIMDFLQAQQTPNPFDPIFKKNAAIRQLIFPGGMGGTFNVLIQSKSAPKTIYQNQDTISIP